MRVSVPCLLLFSIDNIIFAMENGALANSNVVSLEREFDKQVAAGLKRRSVSLAQQEALKSLQLQQKDSPQKPDWAESSPSDVIPDADEWIRLEETRNHLLRDLADRRRRTTARYRSALASHLTACRSALVRHLLLNFAPFFEHCILSAFLLPFISFLNLYSYISNRRLRCMLRPSLLRPPPVRCLLVPARCSPIASESSPSGLLQS